MRVLRIVRVLSAVLVLVVFSTVFSQGAIAAASLGKAYQQQGDFESARGYLKQVTKLAPESPQARVRLAINELMGGNSKAGVAGL